MYHSGIAGGGFALVRSSGGTYEAVDFRESAPASAYQDMYNNSITESVWGGLSAYVAEKDSAQLTG
jgi:gamma-glutamyltranspeptidase/glutathione hydrolase